MTKFIGRRGELAIGIEATRGTAASTLFPVPRTTISFDDKATYALEEQGLGKIADSDSNHLVSKQGDGEIEAELYDKAIGVVLTSLFGAVPSTAGGNPYTHTYTLQNTNQHKSVSLLYQDPDLTKMFRLGVVNRLTLTVEPNATVKWTVGFMSKASQDWTSQTLSYTSLGAKWLHQHLQTKIAASIAGLSGASVLSLKRLELNIIANTMHDQILGTVEPEDVLNQQFTVEGSLELNKEDDTYRDLMLDNTYRSMEIKLNGGSSSQLTLQLPRVSFTEWEQDRTLSEIVTQSINFKGHYDAANALDIISTATLVNAQSSY